MATCIANEKELEYCIRMSNMGSFSFAAYSNHIGNNKIRGVPHLGSLYYQKIDPLGVAVVYE